MFGNAPKASACLGRLYCAARNSGLNNYWFSLGLDTGGDQSVCPIKESRK